MHIGDHFSLKEALLWTRRDILKYALLATIITVLYEVFDLYWFIIPWLPMALIGTAVAFLIGFKNNATYDRLWEARKIWGGIVNDSRTWGVMARDFVSNLHADMPISDAELLEIRRRLLYRHIAWLTCMRYQLRMKRPWEHMNWKESQEFKRLYVVPEEQSTLKDDLEGLISDAEIEKVLKKQNPAAQILSEQSLDLKNLSARKLVDDFRHMELEKIIEKLYEGQGKSERIKNFPFPRQFATMNVYFVWLFLLLLPLGLIGEFHKINREIVWLMIPFSTLVSWVFHSMEKIGAATENPFQGGPNDIPITNLCETVEIDLRQMLEEENVPVKREAVNYILM